MMNRFQNPHAGYDNSYPQQGFDPRAQQPLPPGHPFGPMYPPSMMRPVQPNTVDPRFQQQPQQGFVDPRMARGPVIQPNMIPPQGYDPRYQQPPMDPRGFPQQGFVDPRQMNVFPQSGNGMVQPYTYQVETAQQPQQRNYSSQGDSNRFGTPEPKRENVQPQPEPPKVPNKKEFMVYSPYPSNVYNDENEGYKIATKKSPVEAKAYSVNRSVDLSATVEAALESIITFLCVGDSTVASQMLKIEDQYHRVDFNQEVYDMLVTPTVKDLVFSLTEHFRKVKNKDVLIVLSRLNEFLTQRINDLLLINSPGVLAIDNFKDDYFDLMRVLQDSKQVVLMDAIEGFFDNIRNTTSRYELVDDTPEELLTMIPQFVTVTAIDAIAREARLEHLVPGVTLSVQDSNGTKYMYSMMKMVKDGFISVPEEKRIPEDFDKRYIKHYLVTLDKRMYEMTWSEIDGSSYITRLA